MQAVMGVKVDAFVANLKPTAINRIEPQIWRARSHHKFLYS